MTINYTLPEVGDRLKKKQYMGIEYQCDTLLDCVVIYVNKRKGWYEVEFVDSGIRECFKLPEYNNNVLQMIETFKKPWNSSKAVIVLETGDIYPSIGECAKALGVNLHSLSNHLNGRTKQCAGYHVSII